MSPVPLPRGVVFWAPPPPSPLPPGARVSPRSPGFPPRGPLLTLPPRASIPPRGPGPGHPLYFPHCFPGSGDQTSRLPDFQTSRLSGRHVSWLPALRFQGTRLSGARVRASRPAFMLSGFQEARLPPGFLHTFRGPGAMLPGVRGLVSGPPPCFTLYFPEARAMLSGARASALLSGDRGPGLGPGLHALTSHTLNKRR